MLSMPKIVSDFVAAVNSFDTDAVMACLSDDAMVNDRHRQFWGEPAIRRWCEIEITGDHLTMDVTEVINHYGDCIVTAIIDGDFDKSELPAMFKLQFYMTVRDSKLVQIIVLPVDGRKLSKPTETSEAATHYASSRQPAN